MRKYGKDVLISFQLLSSTNYKFVSSFCCDNESIDEFFYKKALLNLDTITYVFLDKEKNRIITFSSICYSGILEKEMII